MPGFVSFSPLRARDPAESHRAATQLELFFDLVSVIAIASITAGLHHAISEGHGLEKLPAFAFLFTAIWWAWMNFTWFASAFDNDGPVYRLLVMVIMAGELIFAGGASYLFDTLDLGWAIIGWIVMRLGMAGLWFRVCSTESHRVTAKRYTVGILIAQAYWVLLYFVSPPGSALFYALGILGFLIEFAVPIHAERAGQTPFHRHHMIERYGLLTIISLGEIMLSISLGFGMLYGGHAEAPPVLTALSALVIVFALFWVYFCEEEHLPDTRISTAFIWGYGHIFIFGGVAALGAGIAAELDLAGHHGHATQADIAWWIGVPMALVFLALWVTRDRYFTLGVRGVCMPALAAISLAGGWAGISSWGFAAIAVLAVVCRVPLQEPG